MHVKEREKTRHTEETALETMLRLVHEERWQEVKSAMLVRLSLTYEEKLQVVRELIQQGLKNKMIAELFYVSDGTVSSYIRHLGLPPRKRKYGRPFRDFEECDCKKIVELYSSDGFTSHEIAEQLKLCLSGVTRILGRHRRDCQDYLEAKVVQRKWSGATEKQISRELGIPAYTIYEMIRIIKRKHEGIFSQHHYSLDCYYHVGPYWEVVCGHES